MIDPQLGLNGAAFPLKDLVCRLIILLDPHLSLDTQVASMSRDLCQLRLVCRLRMDLRQLNLSVVHALVTSWFDYYNVLRGLPLKMVWMLQFRQKVVTWLSVLDLVRCICFARIDTLAVHFEALFKVLETIISKALCGIGIGISLGSPFPIYSHMSLHQGGPFLPRHVCRPFLVVAPYL